LVHMIKSITPGNGMPHSASDAIRWLSGAG
jgi:hypothetical protein